MKKGFTLMELLAVIVVLALLSIIIIPEVTSLIKKSKEKGSLSSAEGYIKAVNYRLSESTLENVVIKDGNYFVDELGIEIELNGEAPSKGVLTIENGEVKDALLCFNKNKIEYDGDSKIIGKCETGALVYEEGILNGADPIVKDELVPVILKEDGTVIKADVNKPWYKYKDKKWANAVILDTEYEYEIGKEIFEDDIKEYYVWVPKYAYKLWNVNSNNTDNVGKPIEIVFGSKAKTTGENNGDMYLHPAFENFNTNGIWVGKFEVSYNEETYTDSTKFLTTNPNYKAATDSNKLLIKPNVRNLSNKTVSEFHTLLFNSHRDLNSHMITNMEWGATAYLTYSIYGRCDSETCTEVTNNNVTTGWYGSSAIFEGQWQYGPTITGCAADNIGDTYVSKTDKCVNDYNSKKGDLASTTGNITGIYDMSGGDFEYVMGVLVQENGTLFSGQNSTYNSGFKGIYGCPECGNNTSGITKNTDGIDFPNKKYYNAYTNNYNLSTDIWYNYDEGKLGDATKEIANTKTDASSGDRGNWFSDYATFATPTNPWMGRGGAWYYGNGTGMLAFHRYNSGIHSDGSTRLVLAF